MKCPSCKEVNLVMSERKGIEIDYCPDCRGVWLDRGELDKIIERTLSTETSAKPEVTAAPPQMTPQTPSSYYPQHYDKHYKRRKSFLEELFD